MKIGAKRRVEIARRVTGSIGLIVLAGACSTASAVDIGPGFTGAWYDPQQSGHGLFLEVLPNNQLLAFWFTFTPDGTQQSWFGGVGPYSGNTATVPVNLTTGGRWIPNFDESKRVDHPWGTLTFTFTDCNSGRVDFTSTYPGYGSNHMDLTRLTQPAGLACASATKSAATGVWSGTTTAGENAIGVVLEDGSYEIVYTKAGTSDDAGVVRGTSSIDAGTLSSSDAMNYPIAQTTEATGFVSSASVGGSVVPSTTLQLALTTRGVTRTFSATFVAGSDQAPNIEAVAGHYSGYNGHVGGRQTANFAIGADGTVSGSNAAGCGYSGAITARPDVRAFDWTITATNVFCIFGKRTLSGLLYYDEAAHKVHAFAPYSDDAGAADQYFMVGTKG